MSHISDRSREPEVAGGAVVCHRWRDYPSMMRTVAVGEALETCSFVCHAIPDLNCTLRLLVAEEHTGSVAFFWPHRGRALRGSPSRGFPEEVPDAGSQSHSRTCIARASPSPERTRTIKSAIKGVDAADAAFIEANERLQELACRALSGNWRSWAPSAATPNFDSLHRGA